MGRRWDDREKGGTSVDGWEKDSRAMSLKRVGCLCDARCAGEKGGTSPGLRAAAEKGWDVPVMSDCRLKRVGRRADEQKGTLLAFWFQQ